MGVSLTQSSLVLVDNHLKFIKETQEKFGADPSYITAKKAILDVVLA
jgi:hypothetical protein